MAQALADDFGMYSLFQKLGGMSMAKIMKSNQGKLAGVQDLPKVT